MRKARSWCATARSFQFWTVATVGCRSLTAQEKVAGCRRNRLKSCPAHEFFGVRPSPGTAMIGETAVWWNGRLSKFGYFCVGDGCTPAEYLVEHHHKLFVRMSSTEK